MDFYFQTKRLIIRKFRYEDWLDLYEILSDEETVKYQPYLPFSFEETKIELNNRINSPYFLAVELKEENKLIGSISLTLDDFKTMQLGYIFNRRYWKYNYAFEAIEEILDYILNSYKIHRIIARCNPENINSWKLLERLGFKQEAYFKKDVYYFLDEEGNPKWQDSYIYVLSNKKDT